MSEGLNCLGVFMCGPALSKYRVEAPDLLRRWEAKYAPVFRQVGPPAAPGDAAMFSAALAKLSCAVTGEAPHRTLWGAIAVGRIVLSQTRCIVLHPPYHLGSLAPEA